MPVLEHLKKEAEYDWPQEPMNESDYTLVQMQQKVKQIAKHHKVLGIEQTKEEKWVIVSQLDDGQTCQIMINSCTASYDGHWEFALQAEYYDGYYLHIDDIKGEENQGFGTICMNYLKEHAREQNIHQITGDLAKRDWQHLDRLVHFYKKHHFDVTVNNKELNGTVVTRLG